MSERRGTKALETWCRRLTEGYPGVKVENMTTSWRDGLAFCAIIHHFRPDLIDFGSLNKSDVYYNNSLAFRIAEHHLGIPALLDAEDMVEYQVPDRLSILTYLSQFYQVFGSSTASGTSASKQQGSPARLVPKRSQDRGMISPSSTSPPTKMASRSSIGITGCALGRREPCAKCSNPVFLAERLNVGTKLYHRTCFRCARCNNQLSLANYYETEAGQYCCETCPDEEVDNPKLEIPQTNNSDSFLAELNRYDHFRNRSLSDEEKQKGLLKFDEDEYSAEFENALEDSSDDKIYQDDSLFAKARSQFLNDHLNENDALVPEINLEDAPPPLPNSEPPDESTSLSDIDLKVPDKCATVTDSPVHTLDLEVDPDTVNTVKHISYSSNQQNTASDTMLDETTTLRGNNITKDTIQPSLVKSRMLLFEATDKANTDPNSIRDNNVVSKYNNNNNVNTKNIQISDDDCKVPLNNNKDVDISIVTVSSEDSNLPSNEVIEISDSSNNEDLEFKSPETVEKTRYVSMSSENLNTCEDSKHFISIRSEISSDSIVAIDSSLNDVNSPSSDKLLRNSSKSVLEDSVDSIVSVNSSKPNLEEEVSPNQNELLEKSEPIPRPRSNTSKKVDSTSDDLNITENETKVVSEHLNDSISSSSASKSEIYPEDLNPFGDEDEDEEAKGIKNNRQIIKPSKEDLIISTSDSSKKESSNPFGSSDDEDDKIEVRNKPPRPPPLVRNDDKKIVKAPRVSLNPFWSEEEEQEDERSKPVPKPRTKNLGTPEPKPRRSVLANIGDRYDSNTSLSSMCSSISHTPGRKKKPAPPPPSHLGNSLSSPQESIQSSPSTSIQPSPKSTPRLRKNRKAPLPPTSTSTPVVRNLNSPNFAHFSSFVHNEEKNSVIPEIPPDATDSIVITPENEIENEKISKDEKNRNRQSQNISSPVSDSDSLSLSQHSSTDKSTHGKWKRKKGPAPSRPVPQRRQIRPLPLAELRRELDIIEMQQQGLEKQGVKLEQLIREKCETPGACDETNLSPEVEELVLELFELVNEKNELFRRQAELMYLRRQQKLEEEYADIEYQIRCLMDRPEMNKTDSDKTREEELIKRLVEVVERRNEIVECLEMDRVREAEEDHSINTRLTEIATRREEESQCKPETPVKLSKKEKKKIKKEKKLKGKTLDADKDIDESETSSLQDEKRKEKKKKIWFLHK